MLSRIVRFVRPSHIRSITYRYPLHRIEMSESDLKSLQEAQQKAAEALRFAKERKESKEVIDRLLSELQCCKAKVEQKAKSLQPLSDKIDFPRAEFQKVMTRRFFFVPSFEIYGGIAGLYDLGPPATAIKANMLSLWRQHFVLPEAMLEIDCSSVTPAPVLTTSGHTAKFCDLMVKDVKTLACYRADHLLEQHLEKVLEASKDLDTKKIEEIKGVIAQADAYDKTEMANMFKKYNVKAPDTNNDLTDPEPFNLMFNTQIGPTGTVQGFLRPETAQGIFVNFKRLLDFNGNRLPFAAAQIGQAFRNEIAPRSGLLRVREFTLAEIEHFVNPDDKSHPKFDQVASMDVLLFPRDLQTTTMKPITMTVGEAVRKGTIANQTLGYYMGRVWLFLLSCGVRRDRVRFRQHLKEEMAHYATDCWDAEIQCSYGWVEVTGIADRSCFDLSAHSRETKESLTAFLEFKDGARSVDFVDLKVDKSKVGKQYKAKAQTLLKYLSELPNREILRLEQQFTENPVVHIKIGHDEFDLPKDCVQFAKTQKRVTGEHVTPAVIEPSFGIGRILYCVLEHNYWLRENDEQRAVLSLPAAIATVKTSLFSLVQSEELTQFIPKITASLTENYLSSKIDDSGASIGRRYARTDELGIPFAITIDKQTVEDGTITLRERDSTAQVRIRMDEVASVIRRIVAGLMTWSDVQAKYPKFESKEA